MTSGDGLHTSCSWDALGGLNIYATDHTGALRNCIPAESITFALGHITS